jgi:hypothetical protein
VVPRAVVLAQLHLRPGWTDSLGRLAILFSIPTTRSFKSKMREGNKIYLDDPSWPSCTCDAGGRMATAAVPPGVPYERLDGSNLK